MAALFAFFATAMFTWVLFGGYNWWLLSGYIPLNYFVGHMFAGIILSVQIGVISSVCLKCYCAKIFIYSALYSIMVQILFYFGIIPIVLGATIIPSIFILLMAVLKGNTLNALMRFIGINAVIFVYFFFVLLIRYGAFHLFNFNMPPLYESLIISIDVVAIFVIIYIKKGVIDDGWNLALVQRHEKGREHGNEPDAQIDEEVLAYRNAKGLEWAISRTIKWGSQLIQWGAILVGCALIGLMPEGAILSLSFGYIGYKAIPERWHPEVKSSGLCFFVCAGTSALIFMAMSALLPGLYYSKSILIIASLGLCYFMHLLKIHTDEHGEMKQRLEKIDSKPTLTLEIATEEDILNLCTEAGLRKRDREFALSAFHHDLTAKELSSEFNISVDAAAKKRSRLRNALKAHLPPI